MSKIDIADVALVDINRNGKISEEQSKGLDTFYREKYKSYQLLNTIAGLFTGFIWLAIVYAQGIAYQRVSIWFLVAGFLILISAFCVHNILEKKRLAVPHNTYRAWNKQIQSMTAICSSRQIMQGKLVFFTKGIDKEFALFAPPNTVFKGDHVAYNVFYIDKYLLSLEAITDNGVFIEIYNARLRHVFNFSENELKANSNNMLSRRQSVKIFLLHFLLALSAFFTIILGFTFCLLSIAGVFFAIPVVIIFIFLFQVVSTTIKNGFDLKLYEGKVGWTRRGGFQRSRWYLVLKESKTELYVYWHQIHGFVNGVYKIYHTQGLVFSIQFISF